MPDSPCPPEKIRACIFDVDGTLYDARGLRTAMAIHLMRAHLYHPFRGLRHARILSAYRRAHEKLRERGLPLDSAATQLTLCCQITGETADTVENCITRFFDEAPLGLLPRFIRPQLTHFLSAARRRGVLLGVFSDYPPERKLAAMGLSGCFDVVACAQDPQIGRLKPDPAGLMYVLERLGTPPSKAMYIGDRPEVDAESAKAAGMRAAIVGPYAARRSPEWLSIRSFGELSRYLELDHVASITSTGR